MQNVKEIKIGKYRVESFIKEGKFLAKAFVATPKGKYRKEKCLWFYRFPSEGDRDNYVKDYVNGLEKREAEVQARKAKKKEILDNIPSLIEDYYKVGEFLYDSWGYEQTNIDFYQIIEIKNKSIVIQRVGSEQVQETGWLQGKVVPVKDNFIGEPELKRVLPSAWNKENPIHVKSKFGWISKWDKEPVQYTAYA